jgi:hypothetical protein
MLMGLVLISAWEPRLAAAASAALFTAFALLIGRAAVRESLAASGGCGCFGPPKATPTGDRSAAPLAITRNLVLASVAVAVASAA